MGARAPAAWDLARRLHAQGHEVMAADSVGWHGCRSTRAVSRCFRLPPPRTRLEEWTRALNRIPADLIIPTCEEVFYLAHQRPGLKTPAFCAGFATLARLHSKWTVLEAAAGCGARLPDTRRCQAQDGADRVYKPEFSRFGHCAVMPGQRRTLSGSWVSQQYVSGRELASYSIAREGRLRAHACYEPRFRIGVTAGVFFEPVECSPAREFTARLVAKLGYTGQLGFDFKLNAEGLWLLECNPRANSGLHLFGPELASAFLEDGPLLEARGGPACLGPAMLCHGPKGWRELCRAREVVGDGLAGMLAGLGEAALTSLRRGISFKAAATADIEWDGQELG